ncbi:MAG: hypothetical protein IPK13_07825 [Deltaproteobacteria bacterium]|nr:hypothetical protein [Deltaproteobacteria bacterium]
MLQGFNHNIRYRERVFHVQTEDSGISLPRVVTQLFLDGQVLAFEKKTYEDILARELAPEERDVAIRDMMQDQHKSLMRNLVRGTYDDIISMYVEKPSAAKDAATDGSETIVPTGPTRPPASATKAQDPRADSAEAKADVSDDAATVASAPAGQGDARPRFGGSLEIDFEESPPVPSARRTSTPGVEEPTPDLMPPTSDTLVDFGLPAGLRERLRKSLTALRTQPDPDATDPSTPALDGRSSSDSGGPSTDIHAERQNAGAQGLRNEGKPRVAPPRNDQTLIDVGSADLRWRLAQEREARRVEGERGAPNAAAQRGGRGTPRGGSENSLQASKPRKSRDESRPNILVVERSLDEVILSYLADDE